MIALRHLAAALCMALLSTSPAKAAPQDCQPAQPCAHPMPVKVVIVSLFEIGKDEGDFAGEFQLWKQRRGLTQRIAFPQGFHDLYYNPKTQVLGMVTGVGTARSTAATMAVGLDPRLDLTHAYWLVAGIAGIDPGGCLDRLGRLGALRRRRRSGARDRCARNPQGLADRLLRPQHQGAERPDHQARHIRR